jgi:hypothetical protein
VSEAGATATNMAEPDVGPDRRLYAMMQHLMVLAAHQELPEPASPRNIVTRDDALDAVLQLAAVIDEATQAGRIPAARGVTAAALLMLIRDYLQPLPAVPAEDGITDRVTPDLAEMARILRRAGGESGIQG